MTHTAQTADRSYIRPDFATSSAAGHAILRSNIGYQEKEASEYAASPQKESSAATLNNSTRELVESLFEVEVKTNAPLKVLEVKQRLQSSSATVHLPVDDEAFMKQITTSRMAA